jgi:hypothetical protein
MDSLTFKIPGDERPKRWSDCSRGEKLFILRSAEEGSHRHAIFVRAVKLMYEPSTLDPTNNPPNMTTDDFRDTCNKSVPVYIIQDIHSTLLRTVLHNYIYRRWFRPYRSETEHDRFICKFIALQDPACLDLSSQQPLSTPSHHSTILSATGSNLSGPGMTKPLP